MTTLNTRNQPQPGVNHPAVAPSTVLNHGETVVSTVAARLWPGERVRVGPHLPSVTNYVTSLQVGGRSFVAKYSLLGTSLVSVIRGLRGTWPEVQNRQQDYVADPRAQLARERAQLRVLVGCALRGGGRMRVPEVIAYEAGVLITVGIAAPSLSTALLCEGRRPDELLSGVADTARCLQRELAAVQRTIPAVVLSRPHSSIAGTYARKFLSPHAGDYLTTLGHGWADPAEQRWIRESLTGLGSVLAPLLRSPPSRVAIYGDLKPEHVLLDPAGWQIWIDPGLQHADRTAELAKLVSRTALLLITVLPSPARITAILVALDQLVPEYLAHHGRAEPSSLRRLVALWLADWANYLATGLSLPPGIGLPLPPTLQAATAHARPLLALATDVAAHLVTNPTRAWCVGLHGCGELACAANGDVR